MLFLTTPKQAQPINLEDMVASDDLNYEKWIIEALNGEIAKHKAKRLDKFSRFIYDVDQLQTVTGLKREKQACNKQMWSVWY